MARHGRAGRSWRAQSLRRRVAQLPALATWSAPRARQAVWWPRSSTDRFGAPRSISRDRLQLDRVAPCWEADTYCAPRAAHREDLPRPCSMAPPGAPLTTNQPHLLQLPAAAAMIAGVSFVPQMTPRATW